MNPIRRWDRDNHPVNRFKNELDNVFQRFFDDPFFSSSPFWNGNREFYPVLNVEEKSDSYMIEAEVPGVHSNDIEIDLDGNVLTIKGERKVEEQTENENTRRHLVERRYGSFQRSLTLPDNTDPDGITAESRNGVLYIKIPKSHESKPRRIDIRNRDND